MANPVDFARADSANHPGRPGRLRFLVIDTAGDALARTARDLPVTKSEAARRESERFLEAYRRHLREVEAISLTILVWGKRPDAVGPVAAKRRQIRDALMRAGHNALFSEDMPKHLGRGLSEKTKELAQARAAHLVICLMEDSPGASGEFHDFGNHPDVSHKFFLMIPTRFKGGYSANGAVANLEAAHRGVHWYEPRELRECHVLKKAIERAQALREIHYAMRFGQGG